MTEANTITINGTQYDPAALSEKARSQITAVRYIDQKVAELEREIAVLKTARGAYAKALTGELPHAANADQDRHQH